MTLQFWTPLAPEAQVGVFVVQVQRCNGPCLFFSQKQHTKNTRPLEIRNWWLIFDVLVVSFCLEVSLVAATRCWWSFIFPSVFSTRMPSWTWAKTKRPVCHEDRSWWLGEWLEIFQLLDCPLGLSLHYRQPQENGFWSARVAVAKCKRAKSRKHQKRFDFADPQSYCAATGIWIWIFGAMLKFQGRCFTMKSKRTQFLKMSIDW